MSEGAFRRQILLSRLEPYRHPNLNGGLTGVQGWRIHYQVRLRPETGELPHKAHRLSRA